MTAATATATRTPPATGATAAPRGLQRRRTDPEARVRSAEELYGERGRGQDRRPTMPGSTNGGLVLDVPEFIPGH